MGADSDVVCTLVASSSVTGVRKFKKAGQSFLASNLFYVFNFLKQKQSWATTVPTVITTESNSLFCLVICHHFVGFFFKLLNVGLELIIY